MFRRMMMNYKQLKQEDDRPAVENEGNSLADPVPGKKLDGEKWTQQFDTSWIGKKHFTGCLGSFEKERLKYCQVMIRNQRVTMKISSVTRHSYVNEEMWNRFGQPNLQPTGINDDSKGYFVANVHYAGRVYQLPLMVWKQNHRHNFVGRSWFPALHLNWNKIFRSNTDDDANPFQPESAKQRQLALEMADKVSKCFHVKVRMGGIDIQMSLDTGCTASRISLAEWERLGKPPLQQTTSVVDSTDTWVVIEGECNVQVEYNGQSALLPVAVCAKIATRRLELIGSNGFNSILTPFLTKFNSAPRNEFDFFVKQFAYSVLK